MVLSSFRAAKRRKSLRPKEGWREPDRKESERCPGGRKRGGGKRDSQGGGKREKRGNYATLRNVPQSIKHRGTVATKIGREV